MPIKKKPDFLIDADVLIDYLKTDDSILQLAGRHVFTLHAMSVTVAQEVDGLDPDGCARLGLQIIEPNLDQIMEATDAGGPLSFYDRLCLLVAKERTWGCLTNDKALRKTCGAEGIKVMWGLELMVELVKTRHLGRLQAVKVAEAIHKSNPTHITAKLIERFKAIVLKRP